MAGAWTAIILEVMFITRNVGPVQIAAEQAKFAFDQHLSIAGDGPHEAVPESASVHENCTVTSELFHPKLLASGACEPVMTGGVRSMLMPATVAEEMFPATS